MLKRLACVSAVLGLASLATISQTKVADPAKVKDAVQKKTAVELLEGKVLDVLEGDTITMLATNGTFCTVKLLGIDAPDTKQNYFKKSRKSLSELIEGEEVKVLVIGRDPGDRYIGSVYLAGRDVGLAQVERGMAWHYKYAAADQPADARKKYALAQEKAMSEKLGLWEDDDPKAPWDFRGDPPPVETQKSAAAGPAETTAADGKKYILGPRGGCYYVSESGRKVYVKDKTLCGVPAN
jgi:endonuclease YncB( thermonuclease family)